MKKLLIFGGTSEGRRLLQALASYPVAVTLCVAGAYGHALLPVESEKLKICVGRLNAEQMAALTRRGNFSCIVDATHPYAAAVSVNIKEAAAATQVPYLRLLRKKSDTGAGIIVPSLRAAAELIGELQGMALITTGSKELTVFTKIPGFKERLYLRVLPAVESIRACLALGFPARHLIAMQGPFSRELNKALLQQFNIRILVTKDSGLAGGFPAKKEAARELGVQLIVLRRPQEAGLSYRETVAKILELLGVDTCLSI
ncbi:MAG: precorrin-6A reductase [Dethiobacteria bacterium]|jgi:precorrin-6A/cobalt-precorrin-6A reductase